MKGDILIVDDNPQNLKLMSFVVGSRGFSVRCARDGAEMQRAIGERRPDLILMDLQLPGTDGFELTRQIKADPASRDVIVIAVTAYAMKGDEDRARAAGCDGYVTKPIDTRALPGIVAEHLARKASP